MSKVLEFITGEAFRGYRTKIIVAIIGIIDVATKSKSAPYTALILPILTYLGVIAFVDKFDNNKAVPKKKGK